MPAGDVVAAADDGSLTHAAGIMVRVQTPQAFRALPLLAAYRDAEVEGFDGTDTSACVQRFTDVDVHVFPGAATNLKVTFAHDVRVAAHLLDGGSVEPLRGDDRLQQRAVGGQVDE